MPLTSQTPRRNRPHPDSGGSTHISFVIPPPLVFRPTSSFVRNPVGRYLAVELEVATSSYNAAPVAAVVERHRLAVKRDGSVPTGCEITTQPAMGDDFLTLIEDLTSAFREAHVTVDHTCGFHVHVDARDATLLGVRRLLLTWAHIEGLLYKSIPKPRRENRYCMPLTPQILNADVPRTMSPETTFRGVERKVVAAIQGQSFSTGRFDLYSGVGGDRYRALNLQALFKFKTVEFRLHAGTTDNKKITSWATFLGNVVDWSFRCSEADLQALLARDSWSALLSLAPTPDVAAWLVGRRRKFDETVDPRTLVVPDPFEPVRITAETLTLSTRIDPDPTPPEPPRRLTIDDLPDNARAFIRARNACQDVTCDTCYPRGISAYLAQSGIIYPSPSPSV